MSDEEQAKLLKIKNLMEGIDLCKSGYAGVDRHGTIKDRRTTQGLIAIRENRMFNTPAPKPIEGELKEGSPEWFTERNK